MHFTSYKKYLAKLFRRQDDLSPSGLGFDTMQDTKGLISHTEKATPPNSWYPSKKTIIFLVIIFIQSTFLARNLKSKSSVTPSNLLTSNGLSMARTVERTSYLSGPFTSKNDTESALAWDSIRAGHGLVAIDQEYAFERNLPKTLEWPEDESKRVYIIEAYHAIHCVRILRIHYLALLHGTQWDWPLGHDMHCFNALREYIMCNPDDTLLYTTGHRDAGHGQKKMCQDWDALRNWAEERSSSYFDHEPNDGNEYWRNYHEGDGLPVGSF